MAFYAFVRAADDVADNPALGARRQDRAARGFAAALTGSDGGGGGAAQGARRCARACGDRGERRGTRSTCSRPSPRTRPSCATATGRTCSATARSRRARSAAICSTCTASRPALYALSDPLCDALQVLNHLQDCQDDYRALDRVYLPLDRFAAAGIGVEELDRPQRQPGAAPGARRRAGRRRRLLAAARDLPRALASRRLAAESAVILAIAQRLAAELRRRDPLAERVELGRAAFLLLRAAGPRWRSAAAPPPRAGTIAAPAAPRDEPARRDRRRRGGRAISPRRGRTSRRWSRPRAPRSIGACACCRAPSATRCTRSTPSAARSTTSPTATRRRRQARRAGAAGAPRSRRCSPAGRAGRPAARWPCRSSASSCPGPSSTR